MQFATKGVAFNFTTKQLEDLAVGARKASIALGINFSDAMDRVIRGISKQEIELFDELGVVTRLIPAFTTYATAIGKSVDELTDLERQTALTIEVQKQLDERFSGIEVYATGFEKLGVAVSNLTTQVLVGATKATDGWAASLASVIKFITPTVTKLDDLGVSLEIADKALNQNKMSIQDLGAAGMALVQAQELMVHASKEVAVAQGLVAQGLDSAPSERYKESIENVSVALTALGLVMLYVKREAIGTAVAMSYNGVATAIGLVTSAFGSLAIAIRVVTATLISSPLAPLAIAFTLIGLAIWGVVEAFNYFSESIASGISTSIDWIYEFLGITQSVDEKVDKLAKATDSFTVSLEKLKEAGLDVTGVNEENIKSFQSWNKGLSTTTGEIDKYTNSLNTLNKTDLQKLFTEFSKLNNLAPHELVQSSALAAKELQDRFSNLVATGTIPNTVTSIEEFTAILWRASTAQDRFASTMDKISTTIYADELNKRNDTLAAYNQQLQDEMGLDTQNAKDLKKKIALLERQKDMYVETQRSMETLKNINNSFALQELNLNFDIDTAPADLLALKIKEIDTTLQANNQSAGKGVNLTVQQVAAYERQLILLKQEQKLTDDLTSRQRRAAAEQLQLEKHSISLGKLDYNTAVSRVGVSLSKLEVDRAILHVNRNAGLISEVVYKLELDRLDLKEEQLRLYDLEKAKINDISAGLASMASIEGLTELQTGLLSTFDEINISIGKSIELLGGDASFLDGMTAGFGAFFDYVASGFETLGEKETAMVQNTVEAMTAVGQMGVSIFEELSASKVAGFDQEIAAEKRKDGASAASLAKIKALEAKKIKEQAKAKKASVIMSTAMAIMQGYAQLGPIAGSVAAAGMVIMGALQVANIDKAASGQMAALGGGDAGGKKSITGGTRDNSVDVGRNASAGEYAFISGGAGQGTASNFQTPGRAGGGMSGAGTSITVGERGPEVITPAMPVNVTPSGVGSGGPSIVFSPVFNAQAIDADGMEGLFSRYSRELYDGLQSELEAGNRTLESL
jgi:hypothetical protein